MHKKISILFSIALLMVIQGCSTQKVSTDHVDTYDFSKLKSYAFAENQQLIAKEAPVSQITMERSAHYITEALNRSYQPTTIAEADFLVRYHIILKDEVDVRSYNNSYGYGGHAGYGYYGGHGMGMGMSMSTNDVQVRNYTRGTLIIDIIDTKTNKHVWRGTTYAREGTNKTSTAAENKAVINNAVEEILYFFPPKPE